MSTALPVESRLVFKVMPTGNKLTRDALYVCKLLAIEADDLIYM